MAGDSHRNDQRLPKVGYTGMPGRAWIPCINIEGRSLSGPLLSGQSMNSDTSRWKMVNIE